MAKKTNIKKTKIEKSEVSKFQSENRYFIEMEEGTSLDGIREKLFVDRYSLKNENGEAKEKYPEQSWRRMAWGVSRSEKNKTLRDKWEKKFYESMVNFRFVPAGRIWTSAGTGTKATMINCYVIPNPQDTREGIIKSLGQMTEISARGGGVGFNLSSLRPKGSYLRKVNGTTSGAVSWANLYSVAAHDIIQQGGTRRGALMIMLWDWHPDIEEFITVKKEQGKILGANLSVCVSDAFMEAVETDSTWELKFPDTDNKAYRKQWDGDFGKWEKAGYPVKVHKTIKARKLWNEICNSAWESAEPGVVFMDRYNKMNNTWYFENNIATNPCGEQGLPAWGVCNLSSINLAAFVVNGKFDYEDFENVIRVGVRFLDDAIDTEKYIYEEIKKQQLSERRVGLGTMGLADALIKMKIKYGSDESLAVIEKIYKTLRDISYETSIELAKEKGVFPKFNAEKFLKSGFMKTMPESIRKDVKKYGLRNAFLTTEAPTGKISLLAGCSSGIEPVFSFSYTQKDRLGERIMYHPIYEAWLKANGYDDSNLPDKEDIPEFFVVADDLSPEEHVNIQALIQKYTDSSISKTVNAPEIHTKEDVKRLYLLAYKTGCKGISYMREGSREGTLVRNKEKDVEKKAENGNGNHVVNEPIVWQRPMRIEGSTYKIPTPVGTAFITINHDLSGLPIEMFISIGRAGSDVQAMAEALGRMISKTLKITSNSTPKDRALMIIDQLKGIGGARQVGFGANRVNSLPDAIAKVLSLDLGLSQTKEPEIIIKPKSNPDNHPIYSTGVKLNVPEHTPKVKMADYCPSCGNATLVHEMGCKTCYGCGYSEC